MDKVKTILGYTWVFILVFTFIFPVIPVLTVPYACEAMKKPELLPHEIHAKCLKLQKRSRKECFQGRLVNCQDEAHHLDTAYDPMTQDNAWESLVSCCTSGVFEDSLCDKWESEIRKDLNAGSVKSLNKYSSVLGHREWNSYAKMNTLEVHLIKEGLPEEARRFYEGGLPPYPTE